MGKVERVLLLLCAAASLACALTVASCVELKAPETFVITMPSVPIPAGLPGPVPDPEPKPNTGPMPDPGAIEAK